MHGIDLWNRWFNHTVKCKLAFPKWAFIKMDVGDCGEFQCGAAADEAIQTNSTAQKYNANKTGCVGFENRPVTPWTCVLRTKRSSNRSAKEATQTSLEFL